MTLPSIGDLVDGRFRIERKLGEGGTSTVYEVSHVITDKRFAIKWLLPELALDDTAVDRFIHEARVGGKFAHPHAVQVYDICKANDSFYMLMELLEGESLLGRLERVGRVSVQEACSIILACAEVLGAAHRKGIIHRDLKPANIFLCRPCEATGAKDEGEIPKLLDFGISMFCSDLHNMSLVTTPRGSVIGTPLYMSPEQMLGRRTDARSDLYSLGAVLYELVSGQPPYSADSYGELVVNVTVTQRAPLLSELVDVDEAFARAVAKAIARMPDERYQTAEELSAALKPFIAPHVPVPNVSEPEPLVQSQNVPAGAGPHAIEFTPAYGTTLRLPRQVGQVVTAVATAGAFAVMLGMAVWYRSTAPRAPEAEGPRPRPRELAGHAVASMGGGGEEHAGVQELWNRGSAEVLTGRAPPDDALSTRGHKAQVSRAPSGKKPKGRAVVEHTAVEAPVVETGALVSSSPALSSQAASAPNPKPTKTLTSTVPTEATKPAAAPVQSRAPATRPPAPAQPISPVEQARVRRSDFDAESRESRQPIPSSPPAAQVSRKDF